MERCGKDKMEKGTTKPIEEHIMLADFMVAEPPQSALPGLHNNVQEIVAVNDKVVPIRRVSGKHVISYVVYVHRIKDGKRLQNRRDDLSFMMQLGLVGSASLRPTAMLGHEML
jgi:hypothetical protein